MPSSKCDQVCRASELPIYIAEDKTRSGKDALCREPPGYIESAFGKVRQNIFSLFEEYKSYERQVDDYIHDSAHQANALLRYLSEESNDTTRAGAIGLGALTGYILGLRGGFFRKLFTTSAGAGVMCAICYPRQTKEYTQCGIKEARKNAMIAYNFIRGVEKDEEGKPIPIPTLPTVGELWDIASRQVKQTASSLIPGTKDEDVSGGTSKDQLPVQKTPEQFIQETYSENESCECDCEKINESCLGHHPEHQP